jgi:sporulation protein YlmC with PRC-barrel domain
MQVIDSKGSVIGNVKDVSVDFHNRNIAFRVATKTGGDLDVQWDDVLSLEDVVLLKKELELPKPQTPPVPPPVQAVLICPTCGASVPGHAKFCPKCGTSIK